MKIAQLILAHKYPAQVSRLVEALQHPGFDFYIHIDKKINIRPFESLLSAENIFFVKKRVKIYWGDWGTIQATLNGFEEILSKRYDYINVMSGQDFPIKSAEYIYQFFCRNQGLEFITCDRIGENWDVASRVEHYHLVNWRIPGKFRLSRLLSKLLPMRVFPSNFQIVGRANWFALTCKAALYCVTKVEDDSAIVRYFKYCWGADEFIFSTILFNSIFQSHIRDNLVYVDFNNNEIGHPKVLTMRDLPQLRSSEKLFARKFDLEAAPELIDILQEMNSQ